MRCDRCSHCSRSSPGDPLRTTISASTTHFSRQQPSDVLDDLREVRGERPAAPAGQLDLVAVAQDEAAEAVPLRFVDQAAGDAVGGGHLLDGLGEHGRDGQVDRLLHVGQPIHAAGPPTRPAPPSAERPTSVPYPDAVERPKLASRRRRAVASGEAHAAHLRRWRACHRPAPTSPRRRRCCGSPGPAVRRWSARRSSGSLATATYFARKVLTPDQRRPDDTESSRWTPTGSPSPRAPRRSSPGATASGSTGAPGTPASARSSSGTATPTRWCADSSPWTRASWRPGRPAGTPTTTGPTR